jgi:acetoin utilization protein AcuB
MRVRDWMSPDPVTVTRGTDIREARRLLDYYGIRHLPVVDDGRVVGMVSDRDVRIDDELLSRLLSGDSEHQERPVAVVMSTPVQRIGPGESVEAAARLMLSRRISALPVVDEEERLQGLITTTDCLLASLSPKGAGASAG